MGQKISPGQMGPLIKVALHKLSINKHTELVLGDGTVDKEGEALIEVKDLLILRYFEKEPIMPPGAHSYFFVSIPIKDLGADTNLIDSEIKMSPRITFYNMVMLRILRYIFNEGKDYVQQIGEYYSGSNLSCEDGYKSLQ